MSRDSLSQVVAPERAVLPSLLEPHDDGPTTAPVTDILSAPTTEGISTLPTLNREDYTNCQVQLAAALCFVIANYMSRVVHTWVEPPSTSVLLPTTPVLLQRMSVLLPTTSVMLTVGLGEIIGDLLYRLYLLRFTSRKAELGRLAPRELLVLLVGCISGSNAMLGVFSSVLSLPAGDVRAVFLFTPIMFLFVPALVLSEPLKKCSFLAAATVFTGFVLVPNPIFFVEDRGPLYMSSHDRIDLIVNKNFGSFAFGVVYLAMCTISIPVHFMTDVLTLGITTVILSVVMGGGFETLSFLLCERSIVICGAIVAVFTFLGLLFLSYGGLKSGDRRKPILLGIIEAALMISLTNFILDERNTATPSMESPVCWIVATLYQMKPRSHAQ